MNKRQISVDGVVLVEHKSVLYKAKIKEIDNERSLVHFVGYRNCYDTWVHNSRIINIISEKPLDVILVTEPDFSLIGMLVQTANRYATYSIASSY